MAKFDFENGRGQTLTGQLELPESRPVAFAIFAHCFTCSKNIRAASQISKSLAELGFGVLRFDFTGLGNSEGDFANTNFSTNVQDLIAASNALAQKHQTPSLLVGHSLGGAAVLMAASQLENVKAVATIGAPSDPVHVQHLFSDALETIQNAGEAKVKLGGRELTIEKQFLEDLQANRLAEMVPKLRMPVMIFHSPVDTIVSIENARAIYESAKHPKSFVSIDGANHMLDNPEDAQFVAATLAAWASRYLVVESTVVENADSGATVKANLQAGEVVVTEVDGNFTQNIRTSSHEWTADEPTNVGGEDLGPTPYDLLLSSLGACTAMTLRIYARHKQLSLDSVRVSLKHSKIHADDCGKCESKDGKIDRIEKEIIVVGDLTDAQVVRLGEIADRCPVHRTLTNEKSIATMIRRK